MVGDVVVSYRDGDGYVYRTSKWERESKSYIEESLVGPGLSAHVQVQPDTVSWKDNEKLRVTLTFTHWDRKEEDFKPFAPEADQFQSAKLEVRLQGRRTPFANYDLSPESITGGSFDLPFIEVLKGRLSTTPTPGTLFELSTAIPGYANIPAVIAVI